MSKSEGLSCGMFGVFTKLCLYILFSTYFTVKFVRELDDPYFHTQWITSKLLRNSINALYRLAGKIFLILSRPINQYGKYRYSYRFSVFTSINLTNGQYDKYHLAELDNCPNCIILSQELDHK